MMKYREKWIEFANFHVDPSEGGSQTRAGLDVYGRLHKRKRKGRLESTHAVALDLRSRPPQLDDELPRLGWRFMVARLLNLTAADQHAKQFISRELDQRHPFPPCLAL
jgi:hypothetical protein